MNYRIKETVLSTERGNLSLYQPQAQENIISEWRDLAQGPFCTIEEAKACVDKIINRPKITMTEIIHNYP